MNARSLPIIEPERVLIEFRATWCPPCCSTLKWLSELKAKYGGRLAVVALAVESPEGGVRSTVSGVGGGLRQAIADTPTVQSATLRHSQPCSCSKRRERKTAKVVYGAPPDLHEQIGKMLPDLMR